MLTTLQHCYTLFWMDISNSQPLSLNKFLVFSPFLFSLLFISVVWFAWITIPHHIHFIMTEYLTAVSPPRPTKASILIHLKVTDKGSETGMGCQAGFGSFTPQSVTLYRTDVWSPSSLFETDQISDSKRKRKPCFKKVSASFKANLLFSIFVSLFWDFRHRTVGKTGFDPKEKKI